MRGRWIGVVVSAVLLGAVPAVAITPAAHALTGETREVIVKPREPRPDVFILTGRVRPDYAKRPAILQRRNCADCPWFAFQRFRTNARSRFRLSIPDLEPGQTKVCYRVKVPGGKRFATALSESNCIGAIP